LELKKKKFQSNICKNTEIEDQHYGLLQNGSPYFISEALEKKKRECQKYFLPIGINSKDTLSYRQIHCCPGR
jgi:hypothetical protein